VKLPNLIQRISILLICYIPSFSIAEDKYLIFEAWQNRAITGKSVNNIQHDNIIEEAKKPEWRLIRKSGDPFDYYRICVPSYENLCLYATLDNDLRTGYLLGKLKGQYLWKFKKLYFDLGNGNTHYKIINLDGKKIHWEGNYYEYNKQGEFVRRISSDKPRVIFEDNSNMWWWSSFLTKEKVKKKNEVELESNTIFNKNDSVNNGKTRTYTVNSEKDGMLKVEMYNLNRDLDLYVNKGNTKTPTSTIADNGKARTESKDGYCAPFKGGTENEYCNIFLKKGDRAYIRVYAAKGYSTFNIKASIESSTDETGTNNKSNDYGSPVSDGKKWKLTRSYEYESHRCAGDWFNTRSLKGNPSCDTYSLDFAPIPDNSLKSLFKAQAIKEGKIIIAKWQGDYGNTVLIHHGEGIYSRYAHLSEILVQQGQEIKKGQSLGIIGNTGNSTGKHLHFSMYKVLENKKTTPFKPNSIGSLYNFPTKKQIYYSGIVLESDNGNLKCSKNCKINSENIDIKSK